MFLYTFRKKPAARLRRKLDLLCVRARVPGVVDVGAIVQWHQWRLPVVVMNQSIAHSKKTQTKTQLGSVLWLINLCCQQLRGCKRTRISDVAERFAFNERSGAFHIRRSPSRRFCVILRYFFLDVTLLWIFCDIFCVCDMLNMNVSGEV